MLKLGLPRSYTRFVLAATTRVWYQVSPNIFQVFYFLLLASSVNLFYVFETNATKHKKIKIMKTLSYKLICIFLLPTFCDSIISPFLLAIRLDFVIYLLNCGKSCSAFSNTTDTFQTVNELQIDKGHTTW